MRQFSSLGDQVDPLVRITDNELVQKLGDLALVGNWFAFLKPAWLERSGLGALLADGGLLAPRPAILFRGQHIALPGATIAEKTLPGVRLCSLTCDKALYRANHDTVRLLIAAPGQPGASLKLSLRLGDHPYAEYPIVLDDSGLLLWSLQDLPEGEYEARIEGSDVCRFEIAEYRLAALNAELVTQHLQGAVLHYTLSVTSFGQPYSGPLTLELQERGQRVGARTGGHCEEHGRCQGICTLSGNGPYTLNVLVGERSATVALKGSEQERRETLTISELGRVQEISLLPSSDTQECRGLSVGATGTNTAPFLVGHVIGRELELVPRVAVEMLRAVVINPVSGEREEQLYEGLDAQRSLRLPIPTPYGVVLLGALLAGQAWEGWCAALRPPELHLQCAAPAQARPGQRITITLTTNASAGNPVPVHLIVKDQRLLAPSDPRVELAACIKRHLTTWQASAHTGEVARQVAQAGGPSPFDAVQRAIMLPMSAPLPLSANPARTRALPPPSVPGNVSRRETLPAQTPGRRAAATSLARARMEFSEVIYNNLLSVEGETSIELKLGDSMTRYTVEAFALDPLTLDWQRAETTIEASQPVYGELSVSPFIFPGDPVAGRLDVGASSGHALVEVRHNGALLPLFSEAGDELPLAGPIPSGSVLYFPAQAGTLTAIVRDAETGETDVSERFIMEPGKLRHQVRRLRLLSAGQQATLQEAHVLALKVMPGLERPFQFFVEGAARYPFG
jgi:hypothetical protein